MEADEVGMDAADNRCLERSGCCGFGIGQPDLRSPPGEGFTPVKRSKKRTVGASIGRISAPRVSHILTEMSSCASVVYSYILKMEIKKYCD